MQASRALWQQRQPLIKFIGKRAVPKIDHTPHVHPAAPTDSLPQSFASYRQKAQSHGPLGGKQQQEQQHRSSPSGSAATQIAAHPYGVIGGHSAKELGSVTPAKGEFWDRNELPKRFHRTRWTEAEIEAIESGGASLF
nr:37s ribosomal protein ymr-31, mitochondrial [Quercus suber]